MKFKKTLIYFLIFISLIIVFLPFIFGSLQNFSKIFYILNYEEKIKKLNLKDEKIFTEKFKQNFLKTTKNVFSTIELKGQEKFPVFFNDFGSNFKKQCFFGEWLNDSFFVYLKNDGGFENFFKGFKEIEQKDLIIFNFFGFCKKFVVKEVKLVATSSQVERFSSKFLTVLLDSKNSFNSFKILIRAEFLEDVEAKNNDFSTLFFKERYLFISIAVAVLWFIIVVLFAMVKVFCLLKKRKRLVKKKYVKGGLYFEKSF